MIYEYKCDNKECELYDTVVDINVPMDAVHLPQNCIKCGEVISRVWSLSGCGTFSDGYRS